MSDSQPAVQPVATAGSQRARLPFAARPVVPLLLAGFAALSAVAFGLSTGDTALEGWRLATRYTARVAAVVFLLVFVTGPIWRGFRAGWIAPFMRNRRYWGLGFALAHIIHLGALTTFFIVSPEDPSLITILGGGLAYVLIVAMAATSNNWSQRTLGQWWHRLHMVGMIYIWIIFAQSYAGRLEDPESIWTGIFGSSLFAAAMLLRIGVRLTAQMRSQS